MAKRLVGHLVICLISHDIITCRLFSGVCNITWCDGFLIICLISHDVLAGRCWQAWTMYKCWEWRHQMTLRLSTWLSTCVKCLYCIRISVSIHMEWWHPPVSCLLALPSTEVCSFSIFRLLTTRSLAVTKRADTTVYGVWYSSRTELPKMPRLE